MSVLTREIACPEAPGKVGMSARAAATTRKIATGGGILCPTCRDGENGHEAPALRAHVPDLRLAWALAVAVALCASLSASPERAYASWANQADTSWYDGSGTYYISSASQLAGLAKIVNDGRGLMCVGETFILAADIDLSGDEWEPIGSNTAAHSAYARFGGVFDGAGHSITGLSISGSGIGKALFGFTEGGLIENLSVYGEVTAFHDAAGVVAQADGTSFAFVKNYVNVTTFATTIASQGGIVGNCADSDAGGSAYNVEMYRCENYGTIYAQNSSNGVGGLVGDAYVAGGYQFTIIECANHGQVVVATGREYGNPSQIVGVGGIIGSTATYGTYWVERCYNDAPVSSGDPYCDAGGIVGHMSGLGSSVLYSYNTGDVSGGGYTAGGVAGNFASDGTIACTYSLGNVSGAASGAIAGSYANPSSAVNNYYLEGSAASAFGNAGDEANRGESQSSDQLKTQARLDALNGNGTVTHFAIDQSKNGGLPILSWQGVAIPGKGGTGGEGDGGTGSGEQGDGAGAGVAAAGGDPNSNTTAGPTADAQATAPAETQPAAEANASDSADASSSQAEGAAASYQLMELAGVEEPEQVLIDNQPDWFNALCAGIAVAVLAWGVVWKYLDFYTQRDRRRGREEEAASAAPAAA